MSARKPITTLALCAALAMPMALLPLPAAQAQVSVGIGVSVGFAPPPLPVYAQPPLPAPGYLWTPGYWAYDGNGYYWVPGAWVLPPAVGLLWTPGYWGYYDGFYRWHAGYWGPRVGFYGGVNYGYGYGGIGFVGGRWNNRVFAYNRAVVNFGHVHVTNVYNNTVIVRQNTIVNRRRVSYNGGANGIRRQPTAQEARLASQHRLPPTRNQEAMRRVASTDRGQWATVNRGRPAVAAATDHAAYRSRVQARESARPAGPAERGPRSRPSAGQRPAAATGRPLRVERAPGAARTGAPQRHQPRAYGNPGQRSNAGPRPANPRSGDRGHRPTRNNGQRGG